jgi:hypothetical protein
MNNEPLFNLEEFFGSYRDLTPEQESKEQNKYLRNPVTINTLSLKSQARHGWKKPSVVNRKTDDLYDVPPVEMNRSPRLQLISMVTV